jgi:glycosyltransferase involved in cell wall biosynthesis
MSDLHQPPKVSIIVPVYNAEHFLRQCLDSIINQTWKDIEVICVNDGSSDGSWDILQEYSALDIRVRIINQVNQGVSVARNVAIQEASGKYILFHDADDWLDLRAIEILIEKAELEDADITMFSSLLYFESSGETKPFEYNNYASFLPERYIASVFSWRDLIDDIPLTLWRLPVTTGTAMYKKDIIEKHQIEFPEGLRYEDNLFFHKALFYAKRIAIEPSFLCLRRKHGESMTAHRGEYYKDLCMIRIMENNFFKETNKRNLQRSFQQNCAIPNLWLEYRASTHKERLQNYSFFRETILNLLDDSSNTIKSELETDLEKILRHSKTLSSLTWMKWILKVFRKHTEPRRRRIKMIRDITRI